MSQTFTHKPWRVAAIQWTGENYDEVKRFIADHLHTATSMGDCGEVQFYYRSDQELDVTR